MSLLAAGRAHTDLEGRWAPRQPADDPQGAPLLAPPRSGSEASTLRRFMAFTLGLFVWRLYVICLFVLTFLICF